MASAELSRRVEKVVGYPPLSELDDLHRRAAGIDDAHLAQVAGHTVETMLGTYTHALGRSHQRIREVLG